MIPLHRNISGTPRWLRTLSHLRPRAPGQVAPWLVDTGSLTRRVVRACPGRMQVRVLRQVWGRADAGEISALGIDRHGRVWLREVQLLCDDQPWVYARTVIPAATLAGPARCLLRLGSRPLGAVLFANPAVIRGGVEVACLQPHHRLYQRAALSAAAMPTVLWGRRSLFWLGERPLLVAEVFLPAPGSPAG
ncbi:putative chorismate pyruvate-lyase [Gammaproteobacteria bacterium]